MLGAWGLDLPWILESWILVLGASHHLSANCRSLLPLRLWRRGLGRGWGEEAVSSIPTGRFVEGGPLKSEIRNLRSALHSIFPLGICLGFGFWNLELLWILVLGSFLTPFPRLTVSPPPRFRCRICCASRLIQPQVDKPDRLSSAVQRIQSPQTATRWPRDNRGQ